MPRRFDSQLLDRDAKYAPKTGGASRQKKHHHPADLMRRDVRRD